MPFLAARRPPPSHRCYLADKALMRICENIVFCWGFPALQTTNHLCKNLGWIMRVAQKQGTPSWRRRALDKLSPLHPCRLAGWFGAENSGAWPAEYTLLNIWQPWTSREGRPALGPWQSPLLMFVILVTSSEWMNLQRQCLSPRRSLLYEPNKTCAYPKMKK